jgi:hypothetical protein
VQGVRVVGGGRYEDFVGGRNEAYDDNGRKGGNEGRRKEVKLDIKRDLEPDVGGYFEEGEGGERRVVGKRVGGGLWGLWPVGGRETE